MLGQRKVSASVKVWSGGTVEAVALRTDLMSGGMDLGKAPLCKYPFCKCKALHGAAHGLTFFPWDLLGMRHLQLWCQDRDLSGLAHYSCWASWDGAHTLILIAEAIVTQQTFQNYIMCCIYMCDVSQKLLKTVEFWGFFYSKTEKC